MDGITVLGNITKQNPQIWQARTFSTSNKQAGWPYSTIYNCTNVWCKPKAL